MSFSGKMITMNDAAPVISAKNVWKLFGANPKGYLRSIEPDRSFDDIRDDGYIAGVKDVSIDVGRGEMLVIMGLSGSGKSTLVRCFCRLHEITGGTIEVEGEDIMSLGQKQLIDLRRRKMGMVFQSFGLLPHRTVLENVAFPLEMRGQDRHERRERALEVIELVGLSGREDYFPRELSGGQQQRAALARAMAPEPQVLLMDEPFASVDIVLRRRLRRDCRRLLRAAGTTTILVTHDPEEALDIADYIAVMEDGRIIQFGSPEDLHDRPATPSVGAIFGGAQVVAAKRDGDVLQTSLGAWPVSCVAGDMPSASEVDLLVHAETLDCIKDAGGLVVVDVHPLGVASRLLLQTASGEEITVQTTAAVEEGAHYRVVPRDASVRAFASG